MASVALDKKALWKTIDADIRAANRARLVELRGRVALAKADRARAIREARERCKAERIAAAARARAACGAGLDAARSAAPIAAAKGARDAEVRAQRELRAIERGNRSRSAAKTRVGAAERRSESDDEVRSNLPEELVPLFDRVRRSIKATARKSRTEAFLEYAESHPSEIVDAEEDATDRLIAELEARQRAGNPSCGGLVLLGRLTALGWSTPRGVVVKGWPLFSAPLLAYDARGKLHVVHGGRVVGSACAAMRARYRVTHGGRDGRGELVAGAELAGPYSGAERKGHGTHIVYTTVKDDGVLTDYEHAWGDGGTGRLVRPVVVVARGMVALEGGSYRVTSRGIVG